MPKLFSWVIMTLLPLLLTGCLFGHDGYIHNRKDAYLASQSEPMLKLPAGTQPAHMDQAYVIPPGSLASNGTQTLIVPPSLGVSPQSNTTTTSMSNVVLGQNSQGFLQLRVKGDYANNWTAVSAALLELGYQVIGRDQKTGVIEVSSAKNHNAVFQYNLAQGDNVTLISILDQNGSPLPNHQAQEQLTELQKKLNGV